MFIQAYLQTAQQILQAYAGAEPFPSFLKKYFSQNKKFGSRDRKQIAHLCFCFFRLGKALPQLQTEERLLIAFFLCSNQDHPILKALRPEWNELAAKGVDFKIAYLQKDYPVTIEDVLQLQEEISAQINYQLFFRSFFIQPLIYLRMRPGKSKAVQNKLSAAQIDSITINQQCIAVPPATKVEDILLLNNEVVIQDVNSQKVLDTLLPFINKEDKKISAWDCCAASGGKSLLLIDLFPNVHLTVSDIRPSILINLKKRFQEAGITFYKSFVADVAASDFSLSEKFDLVICDAPCTGSGTWSRTPEQLYFFNKEKINDYTRLQKQIVQNAAKSVKSGGYLLYITCSVFKKENEEVVQFMQQNLPIKLQTMDYYKGYENRADTLFAALFIHL